MQRRLRPALVLSLAIAIGAAPAPAAAPANLELFGVALKGATRDRLRQAFRQNGLRPTREENNYWTDTYDAQGVLDGATEFTAGYVDASGQFAFAEYTFESFLDTAQVGKVIRMVSLKYGLPSAQIGSLGVGPVTAKWRMAQGMSIEVARGWPDTTTRLTLRDGAGYNQMCAEIDAQKNMRDRQQVRQQGRAF